MLLPLDVGSLDAAADPDEASVFLKALGQAFSLGAPLDVETLFDGERRRRVPLSTYLFERERYWIEPGRRRDGARPETPRRARGAHPTRPQTAEAARVTRSEQIEAAVRETLEQASGLAARERGP